MTEKSKSSANKPDFKTLIPGYSDSEIINILKMRNHYQPEAAAFAIEEGIKRGIINSKQDLLAEEFRVKPLKNTFFPVIENEIQRKKISTSIIRGLVISGVIPGIYGVIQSFNSNFAEGLVVVAGSIIWLVLSVLLFREVKHKIISLLFVLVLLSIIYLAILFVEKDTLKVLDFFIPITFYFLIFYGLAFLRKINSKK